MGNRAVITTGKNPTDIGVYLHWNGGRDSVEAFLAYCDLKGYRSPDTDCYGWARLCQVIGNYFGGTNSLGIDVRSKLDCNNWDNGVYIIKDWEIVDRQFHSGPEQSSYDLAEMMVDINNSMPKEEQLEEEKIRAFAADRLEQIRG